MVLLQYGVRAFPASVLPPSPMIGRKRSRWYSYPSVVAQRFEQERHCRRSAYGVEVIVTQAPARSSSGTGQPAGPAPLVSSGRPDAGLSNGLVPAGRQRIIVPGRPIEFVVGHRAMDIGMAEPLYILPADGVEVHQSCGLTSSRQIPGLTLGPERLRLGPAPGDCRGKRRVVVAIAASSSISPLEEILEP